MSAQDRNEQQVKSPSHWAAEAMAWASTYEQVTGKEFDKAIPTGMPLATRLRFTEFASCCQFPDILTIKPKGMFKIYFSESSKTRRFIVEHVFRPLLGDTFSVAVVDSIFDMLGIKADLPYIQRCLAEWFMTLSIREICKKGLYADSPSIIRYLLATTTTELSSGNLKDNDIALSSIYRYLEESTDLVRAFMLGALCLEAVSKATAQKEKLTLTIDVATKLVNDWKSILRKLRICLLVSLRLHGHRLAAPITIDNVNQPDIFSVFEWLALDELSMSHNHDEIASLEKACSISSYSFDPSLPDGDGPTRFKMLQNSCLAAGITEEERSEYLVDYTDDDRFGALLLFLSSHNEPKILAAHRVLILASKWASNPEELDHIENAVASLKSLSKTDGYKPLTRAVCLEIWQTHLCPIYRAYLFGFGDVQEISGEVVAPLLQNRVWISSVSRIGLQLLATFQECRVIGRDSEFEFETNDKFEGWPPIRADFILQRLLRKMHAHQVDDSALNIHSVVLCAFLVSTDIDALVQCIPNIHEVFVPYSLFQPMISTTNVPELQKIYLNNAIVTYATEYIGPTMDSFDLGEIMTLAKVWNFSLEIIRTLFLLVMYELGKDHIVDELVTRASFMIDGKLFVNGGISIVCLRLNVLLNGGRMNSAIRNAVSVIDAELCEWIKQQATTKSSLLLLDKPILDVPIESTHLLIMRLLSVGVSSNVDKHIRVRIHSLSVLSGILIKAIASSSSKNSNKR